MIIKKTKDTSAQVNQQSRLSSNDTAENNTDIVKPTDTSNQKEDKENKKESK